MDSIPDLILNTCAPHIAPAGDINGDGISDLIVGNLCYNAQEGRGEVFLGGHPPDAEMDYWMSYEDLPKHYEENIGWVVAPASDFNGDGVDDVILVSQNVSPWFYGDVFVLGGTRVTDVNDSEDHGVFGSGVPALSLAVDAYPNPANSSVRFIVRNARAGRLKLWFADILGRQIGQIEDESVAAGERSYEWACVDERGRPLASGVYFAIAECGGLRATRRVILLK
ncbi:MAG: FG-GAP repeat protein [candidate division Zixibacteria bacterium]|nr:FG-GAP repeat protein [candidate division Zixibacteria bacterium]